jgi:hypothetical protein
MKITAGAHHEFLVDVESSKLRVYLRAYFTILFFLLPFAGHRACHNRVKLLLANGRTASITRMTGWLSTSSAALCLFKQRRLPGGWFGAVMLLAGILSVLGDLAVSGLVKDFYSPGRCSFGTGVVLPTSNVSWRSVPSNQQRSYYMVSQAQLTSVQNGGLGGIYWKVNTDPHFRADALDVLGSWTCSQDGKPQSFPANTTGDVVGISLEKSGLLFPGSLMLANNYPDGSISGMLFISASLPDGIPEVWDIRVALDTTSQGPYKPINMVSYFCKLNAPSVEWVVRQINAQTTINRWLHGLYGDMEDTLSPSHTIEWTFNSMVMVGFGGGVGSNDKPLAQNSTQGCLVRLTQVPWEVTSLSLLVTIISAAMVATWCLFSLLLWNAKRSLAESNRDILDNRTPNGLTSWMGHAVSEHLESQGLYSGAVLPSELPKWFFRLGTNGLIMARKFATYDPSKFPLLSRPQSGSN